MTLAIFRTKGNGPVDKYILKTWLNYWKISFLSSFKIFAGMLFGPDDSCEPRENIVSDILSAGVKKKVFAFE